MQDVSCHTSHTIPIVQLVPEGRLAMLSRAEIARLRDSGRGGSYPLFRSCVLAVLACGSDIDDGKALLEQHPDFDIDIVEHENGIRLQLRNAPASAFVDGVMIKGIHEHVFAVLRDLIYLSDEISGNPHFADASSEGTTDAVFHILRNADILRAVHAPNLVVCWGGHSIPRNEYDYTKLVGYELGLRGFDICTGCGPGAMKGPMKGAAIAHSKQRIRSGRYLGFSEPGIIAAEAPNPIVNALVILPDIEKRLEAFVRAGHGIVIFPGGAGTMEEILYLLGILLHPDNADIPYPLVLTGPANSAAYFAHVDDFITATLGEPARTRYRIVINDPAEVARHMASGIERVKHYRQTHGDAYNFNWRLHIPGDFQHPFEPTHESMRALDLHTDQAVESLAANLRRAFSGVVTGNVKAQGIKAIETHGPYELHGEPDLMRRMDELLAYFVSQQRMKLPGSHYEPCYRIAR
jgi:pyrimidine/purine-5'-nucleotide nucleosidase